MSLIRYGVAMSLDGFIAGPNGEADWILMDPELNFADLWAQFDTLLMGRRTYQAAVARLGKPAMHRVGMTTVVASRTLLPEANPNLTIFSEITRDRLRALRTRSKKDIWLMGGGELFRALLAMREVDLVEVSVMPVLLGGGVRLLPETAPKAQLKLTRHRVYHSSGIVSLTYELSA